MSNLVSRRDGALPRTEDQMSAEGVLDKTGRLINPAEERDDILIYSVSGNYTYIGTAAPKTDVGTNAWIIQRFDKISCTLLFANGVNTYSNTWSQRLSYIYT